MCSETYTTPDKFTQYWFWAFDEVDKTELPPLLRNAAGRINMALQASGQCGCTFSDNALNFLEELNNIAAGIMFNMSTVRLSSEQRSMYSQHLNEQLTAIRNGELELCDGETARNYPAWGTAEVAVTPRNAGRIIYNRRLRGGG